MIDKIQEESDEKLYKAEHGLDELRKQTQDEKETLQRDVETAKKETKDTQAELGELEQQHKNL